MNDPRTFDRHLAVVGLMFLLWLIHLYTRNGSIVDPGWAAGLVLCALVYALPGEGYEPRRWIVAAMAGVWGLRLAAYLLFTRVIGHPEEGRYVHLPKKWETQIELKVPDLLPGPGATRRDSLRAVPACRPESSGA